MDYRKVTIFYGCSCVTSERSVDYWLKKKNKCTVILETKPFDNINSAVITSSVSKALQMMTAESMLSKRLVLKFTLVLLYLPNLFSSHIGCILITDWLHEATKWAQSKVNKSCYISTNRRSR